MLANHLTVTLSGSYRKFPEQIARALQEFQDWGVKVLSPRSAEIISSVEGFVSLKGDLISRISALSPNYLDQAIRLVENDHLRAIIQSDFLYLALPGGYCGAATAFETGWALAHQVPVYSRIEEIQASKEPIVRAYVNPTVGIEQLVNTFDPQQAPRLDSVSARVLLYNLAERAAVDYTTATGNATIAVGTIIVDDSNKRYRKNQPRDILLVQTHKWGNRFSIVGGKVQKGEKLPTALLREVKEETALEGSIGKLLCAFDEVPQGGYYLPGMQRIFIDRVVKVRSRSVTLNEEAENYLWLPPLVALRELEIEPNARRTVEEYAQIPF